MGANLDFIRERVVGHVLELDNQQIAEALLSSDESDCDVRTYDSDTPNYARFWSHTTRSPDDSFWWKFSLVGDDLPPEPDGSAPTTSALAPYWQFGWVSQAFPIGDAEADAPGGGGP